MSLEQALLTHAEALNTHSAALNNYAAAMAGIGKDAVKAATDGGKTDTTEGKADSAADKKPTAAEKKAAAAAEKKAAEEAKKSKDATDERLTEVFGPLLVKTLDADQLAANKAFMVLMSVNHLLIKRRRLQLRGFRSRHLRHGPDPIQRPGHDLLGRSARAAWSRRSGH